MATATAPETETESVLSVDEEVSELDRIAEKITEEEDKIGMLGSKAVQHAHRAGLLLIKAKEAGREARGGLTLEEWIMKKCHTSPQNARTYIRIARAWDDFKIGKVPMRGIKDMLADLTSIREADVYAKTGRVP